MGAARDATMSAGINPVDHQGKRRIETFERLGATARKLGRFPNLVEPARIATVAGDEMLARHP